MAEALENIKQDPAIRLVDVRSPEEFRSGHIPGAINLPLDSLSRADALLPDKQAPVYLYCASGGRSGMAVGQLSRMGYQDVKNIGGVISYPGQLAR